MDRQKIFNNFVTATHGKGRSMAEDGENCLYFHVDHPGCAIGCQPGFRKAFQDLLTGSESIAIARLIRDYEGIKEFFHTDGVYGSDVDFLQEMQEFHDSEYNWDNEGILYDGCLEAFCEKWELDIPERSE